MAFYADLHIHSKYSRATSKDSDLEHLALWGRRKGITVIGTGDFTHPAWMKEIKEKLVPAEPGLFRLRDDLDQAILKELPPACQGTLRFMLSVEISTIYKKDNRVRKIHHLIYAPTLEKAEAINARLSRIGNLRADGRPILGLDSRNLLEIVLSVGEDCYVVPAHIWTPWFAVLGSKSGFDQIAHCYEDLAEYVFAAETGLSSDPEMNWRVSHMDRYRLMSNSDAHSPQKLGREVCIFETDLDYFAMRRVLETGEGYGGTLEFFPEEGKYHFDGHRKCNVRLSPQESRALNGLCPKCEQPLTLGVMYRVEELADRTPEERPARTDPFASIIPLPEILAEIHETSPHTKQVLGEYETLLAKIGAELPLLTQLPLEEIHQHGSPMLAEALRRMREGQVIREAGYDGTYGMIRLFTKEELKHRHSIGSLFDIDCQVKPNLEQPKKESIPGDGETQPDVPEGLQEETPSSALQTLPSRKASSSLPSNPVKESNVARGLDPEQSKALEIIEGPLLIIAPPGSGKTRTLTHRVAHLVEEKIARSEECLTITFTRRAANEMSERLKVLLPDEWGKVPVLTFHGLAYRLLSENRTLAGLPPKFRITSDEERFSLVKMKTGWSEKKVRKVLATLSQAKHSGATPDTHTDLETVWRLLENQRYLEGWLDYDDLMLYTIKLLEEHPSLQETYWQRFRWISIDEYQDIDPLQYRLVRLLTPPNGNLCAIGDPDQAIYGFRGANVGFFLRFQEDFPEARSLYLSRNYRSGEQLLRASQQMIAPCRLTEHPQVQALLEDSGKVVIHQAMTDKAEAEFVVHTIEQMIGGFSFFSVDSGRTEGNEKGKDYSFSDFAVLYRTDKQADLLEEAFMRSGIPFQRYSHRRLSENPLVQKLVTALRDPSTRPRGTVLEYLQETRAKMLSDETEAVLATIEKLAAECGDDWDAFLSVVELEQEADIWSDEADRVSLLTVHAAKGLEFDVVFLTGCEDGIFPLVWGKKTTEKELSEERRLFFVGMTRASKRLFLSYARKRFWRGQVREQRISPFLKTIEDTLLERRHSSWQPSRKKAECQLDLF